MFRPSLRGKRYLRAALFVSFPLRWMRIELLHDVVRFVAGKEQFREESSVEVLILCR